MEKVRELIVTQQVGGSQVMPYLGFPLRTPKTWPPAEGGESWVEEWRGVERLLLATLVGKRREGKGSLKPAPWKRRLRAESQPLNRRPRRKMEMGFGSLFQQHDQPGTMPGFEKGRLYAECYNGQG